MQITTYSSAAGFLEAAQAFLERNEALNNLPLGLSMRAAQVAAQPALPMYFASVADTAGIVATAVMEGPHPLVLSGERADASQAVELIGENLRAEGRQISSVVGAPPLAEAFARYWQTAGGTPYRLFMSQRLYALTQVLHPAYPDGTLVCASEEHTEQVARWLMAFEAEALEPILWDEALVMAYRKIRNHDIYVWIMDGRPVTMAGRARPTARGICVNAVYTPPELRRNGYASACVAALSQQLLDQGWAFCMLYTDLSNPTSNAIYQKVGYQPIGDSVMFRFDNA